MLCKIIFALEVGTEKDKNDNWPAIQFWWDSEVARVGLKWLCTNTYSMQSLKAICCMETLAVQSIWCKIKCKKSSIWERTYTVFSFGKLSNSPSGRAVTLLPVKMLWTKMWRLSKTWYKLIYMWSRPIHVNIHMVKTQYMLIYQWSTLDTCPIIGSSSAFCQYYFVGQVKTSYNSFILFAQSWEAGWTQLLLFTFCHMKIFSTICDTRALHG